MGCLLGCLALAFPRVAFAIVWLVDSSYLRSVVPHWMWLVAGFIFVPLTTLAFAFATHELTNAAGNFTPFGWLIVIIALLLDLGIAGSGGASARRRQREERRREEKRARDEE